MRWYQLKVPWSSTIQWKDIYVWIYIWIIYDIYIWKIYIYEWAKTKYTVNTYTSLAETLNYK